MKRLAYSLLFFASMLPAATVDFALLPADGTIYGTAGSTIGWGFSVTNNSAGQWLVFVNLNSDPFVSAIPSVLFDFPILSPGQTLTEDYAPGQGLMELQLSSFLPGTVVNSGQFRLDAEWWDGDPLAGGSLVAEADPIVSPYRAVASSVPEPSTAVLAGTVIFAAIWRRKRRCVLTC
jgi:hypothetical protein